MFRRWRRAAPWALAATLASGHAHARDEARVLVRVTAALSEDDAHRLVAAMEAQLQGTASVATSGDGSTAMCVVAIDRTEAGIVVRFADAAGHDVGAPRVVAPSGEIGASEVATIVRAFVVSQLEAPPPASPPAPASSSSSSSASASAPADSAPLASLPRWSARLGAFYTGSTYASELPWQSGARVDVLLSLGPNLYAGLGYAFHPPAGVSGDMAAVHVTRHSGSVFAGLESSGTAFAVGADLAAGASDTLRTTSSTASALAGTPSTSHVGPLFAFRIHARYRIPEGRGAALDVAPGIELAPGERDLVVDGTSSNATVLSPSVARLRLDVGGTFDGF